MAPKLIPCSCLTVLLVSSHHDAKKVTMVGSLGCPLFAGMLVGSFALLAKVGKSATRIRR